MKATNKSIGKNLIFYGGKTLSSILFPFITLKYATYIFSPTIIGRIEFSRSFVSYFLLFAELGIFSLATRNGAGLREDSQKMHSFVNDVFSLNCITSLIAFFGLLLCIVYIPIIKNDASIIMLFALEIPLTLIGVEWLFVVFEDFQYISLRSIIFQIVSIVLLFVFIKNEKNIIGYVLIIVFASYGAYILNFIYAQVKFQTISFTINRTLFSYLPAALVLFSNKLATIVYVSSDIPMLGFLSDNNEIGLYSIAVRIYTAVKLITSSCLSILLPRFSFFFHNSLTQKYYVLLRKTVKAFFLLAPPCILGLILQRKNLILIVSGPKYLSAMSELLLLSIALLFSIIAMLCSGTILMPQKLERYILRSTVIGAAANILLNIIILPFYGGIGAAFTTLISELIVALSLLYFSRFSLVNIRINIQEDLINVFWGCLSIILVNFIFSFIDSYLLLPYYVDFIVVATISILSYFLLQYFLGNSSVCYIAQKYLLKYLLNHS